MAPDQRIVRTLWHQADLDDPDNPGNGDEDYSLEWELEEVLSRPWAPCVLVDNSEQANLVSSLTRTGMHAPVIDVDIPIRLVPSKTIGHSYLYIEQELSWHKYVDLLDALAKHGIVEDNYVTFTEHRGMSFVRLHPERRPARQRPVEIR